ncbi:DUF4123 domain-containing protein [bacterium]|nr:DUF4123 domain-containing protein [bacterium]
MPPTQKRLVIKIPRGLNSPFVATFDSPCNLTIGRHSQCDIVLLQDASLSRRHLRIEFDGQSIHVMDLGSTVGTWIDGIRLEGKLPLPEHATMTAGSTKIHLAVISEAASDKGISSNPHAQRPPAPFAPGSSSNRANSSHDEFIATIAIHELPSQLSNMGKIVHSFGESVYAVLDSARDAAILGLLAKYAPGNYVSLLPSLTASRWKAYGPFLVDVTKRPELLKNLLEFGWGKAWGIYCISTKPFHEMASHLRSLIIVEGPEGQKMICRYYDPRVLAYFASLEDPSMREAILAENFRIVMETGPHTPDTARCLSRYEDRLFHAEVEISPAN